jgi:hypothetical protein
MEYIGQELEFFAHAKNWKNYYAGLLKPYICGDVLEVGGGIGSTFRIVSNNKVINWTAVEPDVKLANRFQSSIQEDTATVKPKVVVGTISSISASPSYDCIIYIDVLEHIETDYEEMRLACERLRVGGKLIVLSPAHQLLFTEFDRAIGHFRRYSISSLGDVALSLPLNKVAMFYLDSAGLLLSLTNKLLLKQRMPTLSQIRIWDNAIIPISRILDRCLTYRIGKTVIGIWEKVSF